MWVQRTAEEIAQWHKATDREARSHGRVIAGMVWLGISLFAERRRSPTRSLSCSMWNGGAIAGSLHLLNESSKARY